MKNFENRVKTQVSKDEHTDPLKILYRKFKGIKLIYIEKKKCNINENQKKESLYQLW